MEVEAFHVQSHVGKVGKVLAVEGAEVSMIAVGLAGGEGPDSQDWFYPSCRQLVMGGHRTHPDAQVTNPREKPEDS